MSVELSRLEDSNLKNEHFAEASPNVIPSENETCLASSLDDDIESELKSFKEYYDQERGTWGNKCEFFLAIMGYTVGMGSIWRFPILCSRNGGGAFLIPFFFFLITSGGPLYYLEVCLGQFTGQSAGLAFEFCPLLRGLGMLQVTLSLTVLWYLIVTMAWILYFLYSSFFAVLPWTTCNNAWNTNSCSVIGSNVPMEAVTILNTFNSSYDTAYNMSAYNNVSSITLSPTMNENMTVISQTTSPAYEFWEHKVIGRSHGLGDMGSVQLHLVICLFLAWFLCVAAVIKGVKTLGKVVYVTATAPFVFLTILFIKGLTLDGAIDGIKVYLEPDFSKLLTSQVWLEAAIQVFFSTGPSWGGVITMASYNKFHQKSFWSSTMTCVISGFSSFYSGLIVFTMLGFLAKATGRTITEIAKQSGPGLVFVVFPTTIGLMPLPNLWSVLFFLMLVAVVFDSLFGMVETITSGIIDQFPHKLLNRRVLVNIVTGFVFFITAIPMTMNGGIYIFQLADWYFSSFAMLFGSLFECITVCWIYGTERFSRDIKMMTGRDVSILLRLMWTVVVPIFVAIAFIILLTQYSTPNYGDGYEYSTGAVSVGIFVGLLPIIAMIAVGLYTVVSKDGSLWKNFKSSLKPSESWGPYEKENKEKYKMKPYTYSSSPWRNFVLDITGSKDRTGL